MQLISVIVPNYNHGVYLKQRIDSILNQTYENIEVIILDDASTDNSKEIIEQFKQSHKIKHIVYNQQNSGSTYQQWQKGIALATGDFIWIAESDDAAELGFLEQLLCAVKWKEDTVLAFCDSVIWENNQAIDNSRNWSSVYNEKKLLNVSGCYDGKIFCEKYLINHCIICNVSSVLFNASRLKEYTFSHRFKFCEDWLLYMSLLMQGTFIYINKPLNYFRRHEQTVRAQKIHLLHNESLAVLQLTAAMFKQHKMNIAQLKCAYAEWTFKDTWWTSKYHVNIGSLTVYWKQLQLVSIPAFLKFCIGQPKVDNG